MLVAYCQLAVTVTIWPREVVSYRDFILRPVSTFWAMSLVRIFTLAGPPWSLKDHLNFFNLEQNRCLQQHDDNINSNVQHSNSESRNSPRSDMQKVEGTSLPFANDVLTS